MASLMPDPLRSMYTLHLAEVAFSKGVPLQDIHKATTQDELISLIRARESRLAPAEGVESQQKEEEEEEPVLCRWSRGSASGHREFLESCRTKIERAKAIQDERDHHAEAMAVAVALEDKQGLAKLRKPYSAQNRDHETATLHPHYCVGRPNTVLDSKLNQGHRWGYDQRGAPSTVNHGYAHLRDTRDLMKREEPVMAHRINEDVQRTDELLHQAMLYVHAPREPQPQPVRAPAGTIQMPSKYGLREGIKEAAAADAIAMGPWAWTNQIHQDEQWLNDHNH